MMELIKTTQIMDNPMNGRNKSSLGVKDSNLKALKDSIAAIGIRIPLIVSRNEKTDKYTLVAGQRRLTAARQLKLEDVPCVVVEADQKENLETTFAENQFRKNLSVSELVSQIGHFEEVFGNDYSTMAMVLGVSLTAARAIGTLKNLCPGWIAMLTAPVEDEDAQRYLAMRNSTTLDHLLVLAKYDKDVQDGVLERLYDWIDGLGTAKQLDKMIQDRLNTLDSAMFKVDEQVGDYPKCSECPKRTDAEGNRELWAWPGEKVTGRCLDPECFELKKTAKLSDIVSKEKEKGLKVMALVGYGNDGETPAVNLRLEIIYEFQAVYIPAKAKDKNAVRVIDLRKKTVGRLSYMKPRAEAKKGNEKETGKPGTIEEATQKVTKADKKTRGQRLNGLRVKLTIEKLVEHLMTRKPLLTDVYAPEALAILLVYGTSSNHSRIYGQKDASRMEQLETLIKTGGFVPDFWINGRSNTETYTSLQAASREIREVFMRRLKPTKGEEALNYEAEARKVADLFGWSWAEAFDVASKEKPRPKSWK